MQENVNIEANWSKKFSLKSKKSPVSDVTYLNIINASSLDENQKPTDNI